MDRGGIDYAKWFLEPEGDNENNNNLFSNEWRINRKLPGDKLADTMSSIQQGENTLR